MTAKVQRLSNAPNTPKLSETSVKYKTAESIISLGSQNYLDNSLIRQQDFA